MSPRLLAILLVISAGGLWRVAPAMASDRDHETVIPPLHVCTIGELTTFTLEGGQPFHETSCIVQDVRLIALPESTVLLILWEEQDSAGREGIVRVSLRDLVEDGHRETPEWDVDFALVVTTIPP